MLHLGAGFNDFAIFIAVLLRLSIVVFMMPIFSNTHAPTQFKAGFIVALTASLYPFLREVVPPLSFEPTALSTIVLGEIIFGIVFSLSILIIFAGIQLAGELITAEMGFGFAQMADPQSGSSAMLFSVWFQLMATLLFFSLNGHHVVLKIIIESFRTVPIGAFTISGAIFERVLLLSAKLFVIALKVASPVLIVLMLTHFGMGLMAKFSPQLNVLTTSFPVTIAIGLLFVSFSILVWGSSVQDYLNQVYQFLQHLTR